MSNETFYSEKFSPDILKPPTSLLKKLNIQTGEKEEITEGRINDCKADLKILFSFFRQYPDVFLDIIKDPSEKFNFYFYQRIFLRCAMRHRYMYATFPRAYSKSFLAIMCLYLRCIFYPNSKLFIVSGGKEQSAKIAQEKIDELWKFFPSLRNEIIEGHGVKNGSIFKQDYIKLVFKNGSYLDIVAARQSARGGRRTSGLVEESAQVDGKILSEVVIPMMNVSRRAAFGAEDPNDMTNKAQLYITTAGDKGTYAYEKLLQFFLWSVIRPNEAICIGGTWRVPVINGLLSKNFVEDLKADGTYSPLTFAREYESQWGGGNSDSFFFAKDIDKCRVLASPVWEAPHRMERGTKFIIGYDVGRTMDQSSAVIIQLTPTLLGGNITYLKKVVNIYNMDGMHFQQQAIFIKQLYYKYRAHRIIIDANGLGVGLVDFLTVRTEDSTNGESYPPFGVDKKSDPKENYKKFYHPKGGEDNILYLIKANSNSNSEMHTLVSAQIASGKVQFLIDEQLAIDKMKRTTMWKGYSEVKKAEMIRPYKLTKLLKEEMLNLKKKDSDGSTVSLKKISSGLKKDTFSAFEYAIYYARLLELESKNRKIKASEMGFATRRNPVYNRESTSVRDRFKLNKGGRFKR